MVKKSAGGNQRSERGCRRKRPCLFPLNSPLSNVRESQCEGCLFPSGFTRESSPSNSVEEDYGLKLEIPSRSGSSLSSPESESSPRHSFRRPTKSCSIPARDKSKRRLQTKEAPPEKPLPASVTFSVRQTMFGRRGWMVMPKDDSFNMRQVHRDDLEDVLTKIRTMELSGVAVPPSVTVKLNHRWVLTFRVPKTDI